MMTRRLILALLAAALAACGTKEPDRRYAIEGRIKAVDVSARTATIQHGKIGDWMDAMTMEFPVKPDADVRKLHVGDRIRGVVVVRDSGYYVTEITVVGNP